jgi:hypothetical protein
MIGVPAAAIASYKRQKDNELVVRKHSSSSGESHPASVQGSYPSDVLSFEMVLVLIGEKEKKPVPSTSNYGKWIAIDTVQTVPSRRI